MVPLSIRDGAHDALASNPHRGAQGSSQDALRPVADVKARLGEWRDQLVQLEAKMDTADRLSPEMRDWLGQDIDQCQAKIRELELEVELEDVRREIDELTEEKPKVFACVPDESCGYGEELTCICPDPMTKPWSSCPIHGNVID